jgi:hypothetical protein
MVMVESPSQPIPITAFAHGSTAPAERVPPKHDPTTEPRMEHRIVCGDYVSVNADPDEASSLAGVDRA